LNTSVDRLALTVLGVMVGLATAACGVDAADLATSSPAFTIPGIQSLPGAAATPGTTLTQGKPAKVLSVVNGKRRGLISLSIDSVRTGRTSDLANFILNAHTKASTPYYADVTVTKVGRGHIGGAPVQLYGVNGHHTLLPAAIIRGSFMKCQVGRIPDHLSQGASFSTCLMFLAPGHGRLTSVEFEYAPDVAPITWVVHPRPVQH
jgi:hypothetical protein